MNLTIIGLENCNPCKVFKARHPNLKYIEVPRRSDGNSEALELKRKISKLGVTEFPVLFDEDMENVVSLELFDPIFAKEYDY